MESIVLHSLYAFVSLLSVVALRLISKNQIKPRIKVTITLGSNNPQKVE